MNNAVRYQVMPPLSSEEYQELYESIKSEGVLEPIHVDEEGVVIDGHHRSKIASELDIPCPVITHDDLNESQKRSLAFTLNLKRRHLNREQRRALIAESLKSDPQLSNVEHARRTGASDKTVNTVRQEMVGRSEIPSVDKRVDTRGRQQPASQPKREVIATSIPQDELDELNTPSPFVGPGEKIPETSYTTKDFPETEEPTPRAEPITTQLSKAIIELNKAMNRIHRIVEDPNFHRNKQTAWSLHGNDIIRTIDELETIVNNMK